MHSLVRSLLVLSVLGLGACTVPVTEPVTEPLPAPDLCKSADYKGLIGQSRAVLDSMLLPAGTRIIGPDDAVTADFRPERLNIEVGTGGRIEKVACY